MNSGNLQVLINIVQMVVVSSLLPVPPGFWNPSVKGDSLGLPLQLFQCPLHHLVQLRVLSAAITQTARWMAGREFVMKGDDDRKWWRQGGLSKRRSRRQIGAEPRGFRFFERPLKIIDSLISNEKRFSLI